MLSKPRKWKTSMAVELGLQKMSSTETSSSSSGHKGKETSILCSANVGGEESLVDQTLAKGIKQVTRFRGLLD